MSLVWGLLYDLVRAPAFLLLLLLGRADKKAVWIPFGRIAAFALSARATATLLLLNLLCFAVVRALHWPQARFLATFAFSPPALWQGHWPALFLHVFAHADGAHLIGNLVALFVFGRAVERFLGPARLFLAYGLAAVTATLCSALAQGLSGQYVPTLGASGAVAGLIALGVLLSPLYITLEALVPLPLFVVGWLAMATDVLALWSATRGSVDHPAHLGGYLSVLLVVRLLSPKLRAQAGAGFWLNLLTLAFVALLFAWKQGLF